MSVYRLKPKQRGPKCSWCDQLATHRGFMFTRHACANHMTELREYDRRAQMDDHSDAAFYARIP